MKGPRRYHPYMRRINQHISRLTVVRSRARRQRPRNRMSIRMATLSQNKATPIRKESRKAGRGIIRFRSIGWIMRLSTRSSRICRGRRRRHHLIWRRAGTIMTACSRCSIPIGSAGRRRWKSKECREGMRETTRSISSRRRIPP